MRTFQQRINEACNDNSNDWLFRKEDDEFVYEDLTAFVEAGVLSPWEGQKTWGSNGYVS